MKTFRLLVCGSRDWTDVDTINKEINRAIVKAEVRQHNVLIINGGAPGADEIAKELCKRELGLACATFEAPWDFAADVLHDRRKAGPMRNAWMVRWGQPDLVLAFHPYLPGSRGTKNMVRLAREAGVPVRVIAGPGGEVKEHGATPDAPVRYKKKLRRRME